MIVPPVIQRKYANLRSYVRYVGNEVGGILLSYCEEKGYAFVSRYKTVESIAEKIESGRYGRWSDLDDMYAATIVVPTLSDEPQVLIFLESRFQRVAIHERGKAQKAPDVFRYDSTRFIGRLRQIEPITRAPEIDRTRFEIQIRTAFEHAWSVTTHALTYKSDIVDWRRLRLVAQLKAAVEQLDTLVLAFDVSAPRIMESQWPDVVARQTITETFKRGLSEGWIPDDLAPKDWSRFSENVQGALRAGSTTSRRGQRTLVEHTARAMDAIENELKAITPEQVPRSVSLFQLALGLLTRHKLVSKTLDRFIPNVTDELRFLYPEVKDFHPTFDYEESSSDISGPA